jgi:hypothetical protein
MAKADELRQLIVKQCEDYSLYFEDRGPGIFKVWTGHVSGISLILSANDPRDFNYYFLVRTFDVCYSGDRSDAHVIISLMFSSFLRSNGHALSCSLFDIPHPVVPDEIWGRYIVPVQDPTASGIVTWDQRKEIVSDIIKLMATWNQLFWHFASCPCHDCCKENRVENWRDYNLPQEISDSVNKIFGTPSRTNSGGKPRPEWSYLYDIDHEVTIIKSEELSLYLNYIAVNNGRSLEKIDGVNGKVIIDKGLYNFLSTESVNELRTLFKNLFSTSESIKFQTIPMENMIVSVARPYIVAIGRLSGLYEFKAEKEIVRQRHNQESALLFPIPQFEWETEICPDQFEGLIKTLLEREYNVKSVRRASPINQGDKGRDLIIEWNIIDSGIISEISPPK